MSLLKGAAEQRRKEAASKANKLRHAIHREANKVEKVCIVCGKKWTAYIAYKKRMKTCGDRKCVAALGPQCTKGVLYKERYGDRAEEIKKKLWANRERRPVGIPYQVKTGEWWYKESLKARTKRYYTYLMEQKLGRKVTKKECVHHINGDHYDNRLENLQLMTKSEHMILHQPYYSWDNVGFKKGSIPWNKGLTKDIDPRCRRNRVINI